MNRLEYNERIYNYKHGLVNSAGSQTIQHSVAKEEEKTTELEVKEEPQEQEEEIEHSALGDEWDKHKYIRKEEYADGRIRYIYEDGSSQTINTGKPLPTEGTGYHGGGTPGGSYGNKPKVQQTGTPGGVNGKSISATVLNEQRAAQTTPTGLYGNTPKSTPAEKVQDVKLGSKSTPTGLYSNQYKPNNEAYAEARLNGRTTPGGIPYGQTVKDPKISYVAKKDVTPGTLYGATGDRPIADHRIGQGTPGGVNGPALKANSYGAKTQQSAEVWNNLKNAIKEAPQPQTEQPKEEPVITNGTPGGVNGPSLTEGKEAQSFWNIMGNTIKGAANNYAQIGAEAPNNITDVDFENDSVEYKNMASYSVGYALGYLYGNSLVGKDISVLYPDYEGDPNLDDPNFLLYAYNNDPAVKELADMVYNVAVNNYITANDMQKVYENKVSDANQQNSQESVKNEKEQAKANSAYGIDLWDKFAGDESNDPKEYDTAHMAFGYTGGRLIDYIKATYPDQYKKNFGQEFYLNEYDYYELYRNDPEFRRVADEVYNILSNGGSWEDVNRKIKVSTK